MSIASDSSMLPLETPTFPVRRFSLEEYHRMIAASVLSEDEPVELLQGWIVPKMPRTPLHDATIDQACDLLNPLLPPEWRLRVQSAITILDSEPEPDLAIVLGPPRRYIARHPGAADVGLLIEVADSSLDKDRGVKQGVYARAGIETYWIINLLDRCIDVFSAPISAGEYKSHRRHAPGARISLVLRGTVLGELAVADFLNLQNPAATAE